MNARNTLRICGVIALLATAGAHPAQSPAPQTKATPLLAKDLPGIDGMEGLMLVVDLPPGADSPPHRHNASTFVYVLEGTVVMQVHGGPAVTLTQGQTFYESPTDVHTVSRNPSASAPAKLLVFFVKEKGAPASVPVR